VPTTPICVGRHQTTTRSMPARIHSMCRSAPDRQHAAHAFARRVPYFSRSKAPWMNGRQAEYDPIELPAVNDTMNSRRGKPYTSRSLMAASTMAPSLRWRSDRTPKSMADGDG